MRKTGRTGSTGRHRATRLRSSRAACVVVALLLWSPSALWAADTLDPPSRLAALAKVWGLLKYFHPLVAQGTVEWDGVLVDELTLIQTAETKPAFNDEILRVIRLAGQAPRVSPGAAVEQPESDPAFRWIDDQELFDASTISELKTIRHAIAPSSNRYVKATPNIGNPDSSGEAPYDTPAYPSPGMRFLALARFWNMVGSQERADKPNRRRHDRGRSVLSRGRETGTWP